MVTFWDAIPDSNIPWIMDQKLFWVATAPLNPEGHINLSPKGMHGTFHVVNPNKVWYEDISGSGEHPIVPYRKYVARVMMISGVETISHIRENKRITVMFSAFEGSPKIFRLFGKGLSQFYIFPRFTRKSQNLRNCIRVWHRRFKLPDKSLFND
jgi:hypothetical protein